MFPVQPAAVFDIECYPNFFLIVFKVIETGKIIRFQISPSTRLNTPALLDTLRSHLLIGFNSADYDLPMIQLAISGATCQELKEASDDIIVRGMRIYDFAEKHQLTKPVWNHIDLIAVCPLKASLKIYAGRQHCKKMQDLPLDPNKPVTAEEAALLFEYCCNDLENTQITYIELKQQIDLRVLLSEKYGVDLRSKSDPQLAEQVIGTEIKKITGSYPKRPGGLEGKVYKYNIPGWVYYKLPQLRDMLEKIRAADFVVSGNGSITLPKYLDGLDIKIGGGRYRMGIGGLHSSETRVMHTAGERHILIDRDVASYYPAIILNQGLFPQHLGEAFLTVYQALVDRRLVAKRAGDKATAESLKIAVNGSFGKLGSKWSMLYAPDLLIQVTLTGQLALLMLIEMIEEAYLPVISANTDGIIIKCPKSVYEVLTELIRKWEGITGFTTEETRYSAVYSKDVNNYIAIKENGEVKGKGLYSNPWEKPGPNIYKFHKNPGTTIVIEAVVALLRDGVPLEDTIRNCKDVTKFVAVRAVTGGAQSEGSYVGRAVRWYYSRGPASVMNYKKSGNKVPKSDGAKPLMELPDELPADVDYNWYLLEAHSVLDAIGYLQTRLFEAA